MKEILLRPVHHPFKELVNATMFNRLMDGRLTKPDGVVDGELLGDVEAKVSSLLHEMRGFAGGEGDVTALAEEMTRKVETILGLPALKQVAALSGTEKGREVDAYLKTHLGDSPSQWGSLFGWLFVHALGKVSSDVDFEQQSRSWIDEWQLGRIIAGTLKDIGLDEDGAWQAVGIIKLMTTHHGCLEGSVPRQKGEGTGDQLYRIVESLLTDNEVHRFLQVNRHQEMLWFNREAFDLLLWWLFLITVVESAADPRLEPEERGEAIVRHHEAVRGLRRAAERSGYQVEKLLIEVRG